MITVLNNSQPINVNPSQLKEGQFVGFEHGGVRYMMEYEYGRLWLAICSDTNKDPEGVATTDFDELGKEVADKLWSNLVLDVNGHQITYQEHPEYDNIKVPIKDTDNTNVYGIRMPW